MTLEEFVIKYKGKKVDYDGVYGAQCVDLFRQYVKECLNIKEHTGSCSTSGGAKDLFLDYDKMPMERKYFNKITRNYNNGDILIWDSTKTNKYGHVAILIGKLNDSFIVLEQNGFTQNGVEIAIRNRTNLLGALRRK